MNSAYAENNESILDSPDLSDTEDININEPILQHDLEDKLIDDENIKLNSVSDESVGVNDSGSIVNPDFENGTAGWDTDFSYAQTAAHSGSYGLQATKADKYISQTLNFDSIYSISFWASSTKNKVNFNILSDDVVLKTITDDEGIGDGVWKQFTVDTSSLTGEHVFKLVNNEKLQLRIDDFTVNTNEPIDEETSPVNTTISVAYLNTGFVVISLKDENDKVIPNVNITYRVDNNEIINESTDINGQIIFSALTGNFSVSVNFTGNENYSSSRSIVNFTNINFVINPFINPGFEEGSLDTYADVYGWNVTGGAAHGGNRPDGQISIFDGTRALLLSGNYYGFWVSQYLNFDYIDKVTFKYYALDSSLNWFNYNLTTLIGGNIVENVYTFKESCWQEVTIDTQNIRGINLFELSTGQVDGGMGSPVKLYLDDFNVVYNNEIVSNFTYNANFDGENVTVNFINAAIGSINKILWNFDDDTISNLINPTHIFKPGNYNVSLTVYNGENFVNQTYLLSLVYPSIDGKMYVSVQDAINSATDGATIEIPNDITEDLTINQNLTLNFNGNKLTGNINVNDGAIVTVTNISDISSVSADDSSKLTITDSNINSNLELKAGKIDINGVNFKDSVLTITSANISLVNVNVANGGIVVNGGKSKITNSNLTGSNVAISQTAGELEITNNIITDNVKGIEITGGNATITFNAIYNNTHAFNATGATVTSTNNWYGTNTVTFADQYLRLVLKVDTAKMYSGDEYDISVDLTTDNNEDSTIGAGALNDFTLQFTTTNGEVTPVTIHNGKGELKFKAGSVTDEVKLTLFGEEYELEDANIVEKPLQTNINITSTEKGVIAIVLKDSNGKNISNAIITYKINTENEVNKTTDANGIVSIPNLKGAISITVNYAGNDTYFSSNKENNFVFAYDTSILTTVAGNSIIITLKDDENKAIPNANVTYKINNAETTTATDVNGTVTIPNLKGTIALTVSYKGSELYSASNKTDNFVFPYTTTITTPNVSATYNVAKNLVITLKDENGKAVVGRTISVKVGSISKNLVTNNNGQVSVNVAGLVPKTYTATINFEGDSLYTKSSLNTVKVVVAKATPKITAKKATFKAKTKTKKYSITLKNNKGKAMSKVKVTLKVGKKTYKATTNSKGKTTFKITKLTKKGKYTGTIKFAGNKYFKSVSKKVKLTVKK